MCYGHQIRSKNLLMLAYNNDLYKRSVDVKRVVIFILSPTYLVKEITDASIYNNDDHHKCQKVNRCQVG